MTLYANQIVVVWALANHRPSKKHQSENPLRKFLNGCLNDFSAKITKKEKLKSRQKNFNVWTTNLKILKNSKFSSINADQITRALSVLKIWNYFAIEILSDFLIKKFWHIARSEAHGKNEPIIYWAIWSVWRKIVSKKMEPFTILTCNKIFGFFFKF